MPFGVPGGIGPNRATEFVTPARDYSGTSPVTAAGTAVATLSATSSGTVTQTFNASGAPATTLSSTASGTASQRFNASGSPAKTLAGVATGTASLRFNASGTPAATLSAFAAGVVVNTPPGLVIVAVGAPVANLSPYASGTATNDSPINGPTIVVVGTGETRKKKRRKKLPAFEIPEKAGPEFLPLPEIAPTRRVVWEKIKESQRETPEAQEIQTKAFRRRKAQDQLITMILAGAA